MLLPVAEDAAAAAGRWAAKNAPDVVATAHSALHRGLQQHHDELRSVDFPLFNRGTPQPYD
jgi:hypothetical protein